MLLIASLLGGCIAVAPPPNRSEADPADPSAREAALPRLKPNLIASTRIFLDPSAGEGAQKMDHSKMPGMGGMEGMDHSKMPGMQKEGAKPQGMENMPGMDHSKMPGMKHDAEPAKEDATVKGMKKSAGEMKKASDELKAKSDALQKNRAKDPEDHSQHQQ